MKHEHIDVATAKTSELVAFYNKHAELLGKHRITKFSDRATAELRVKQMIGDLDALPDDEGTAEGAAQPGNEGAAQPGNEGAAKEGHSTLSASVAATWQDPMVREARAKRYHVTADGMRFNSVEAAFRALDLPMHRAARFRAKLRDEGTNEINGVKFALSE